MTAVESVSARVIEVISKLQKYIRKYDSALSSSELLTRYILIDPLLRALGWDTEDPEKVWAEYKVDKGRKRSVDYVLFRSESPIALIEVKKYSTIWSDTKFLNLVYQVASYRLTRQVDGREVRVPLGIVTDGGGWYVFNLGTRGSIKGRSPILEFTLDDEPLEPVRETAMKALKLTPAKIARLLQS